MYEKRIVVFLDMMGFAERLANPELLHAAVADLKSELQPTTIELKYSPIDFIHFSDSIVIAADTKTLPDAVMFLLRLQRKLNRLIAIKEIPVRGAITYGDYFYKDGILLSPAVAAAYSLESKFARYPRVVVSKALSDHLRAQCTPPGKFPNFDISYENITLVDLDGLRFLNYLHSTGLRPTKVADGVEFSAGAKVLELTLHKNFVESALGRHQDDSIREKYIWMGNYHNRYVNLDYEIPTSERSQLFVPKHLLQLNR